MTEIEKINNPAYVFWDQYYDFSENRSSIGGIETLIVKLIEGLSGESVTKLIATSDSIICQMLESKKVSYIRIDPKSKLEHMIEKSDIVVTFGIFKSLLRLSRINPYIIYWRVYPDLGMSNRLMKVSFPIIFKKLHRHKSLIFMDSHCLKVANKQLNLNLKSPIIKIPINIPSDLPLPNFPSKNVNISYVGRGTEMWKIKPVKKLVSDLALIQSKFFELHIFTDADHLFKAELEPALNIKIFYYFNYWGVALSSKLLDVSNLHFSMGTAALEGAVLGIPTLIADPSHENLSKNYKYRWVIDDIENYAGNFISKTTIMEGSSIEEILDLISKEEIYKEISIETKRTVTSEFSIRHICSQLKEIKPKGRLSLILKLMPFYWKSKLKKLSFFQQ